MSKELVISAAPHETRVAIVEDGQLCEIYVEREKEYALVGSIYKGRVTRVLPGMQSAFVDIGLDSDAFLYVSDFLEGLEEYDQIVTTVEGKVQRMEQEGGRVFASPAEPPAAVEPVEVAAPGEAAHNGTTLPGAVSPSESTPTTGSTLPLRSEDLPGESRSPASPSDARPEFRDSRSEYRGPRGFGRDREREGRGDRGGRGRGRFGRRGDRDRGDRRHGRDFPSSKYASHRPYEPPTETPAGPYEPVILPGESFAKYRDRAPSEVVPAGEPPASAESAAHAEAAPAVDTFREVAEPAAEPFAPSLHEMAEAAQPAREEPAQSQAPESAAASSEFSALFRQESAAPHAESGSEATNGSELSEAEAENLAAQLVDVEHELAQSQADEDSEEGADFETGTETGEADEGEEAAVEAAAETEGEGAASRSGDTTDEEIRQGILEASGHGAAEDEEFQPSSARVESNNRARFQRPMRRGGRRRGGAHRRMPHRRHHQPPRKPQLISELLKAGQEIIVQIAKEPLGKKGARITSHVALPGRFLVYMPTVDHIGVSRKINSSERRSRLRHLVMEAKASFPGGFIVRTAADGASDDEIRTDVEFLGKTWNEIRARSEQRKAPAMLHRDLNLVERILRDHLSPDYTAIWIDNEEEYAKVLEFVGRFQPQLVNRVKLFTKPTPIFEELGIQQEIDKSMRPKVWLKSGGYIVINHTEALVAIDVNTGKFVGKGSTRLEDTIVRANLEAVKEIVRQVRLRDLGGIIVVDFIDMEERRNRDKVMAALEDALRSDRAPSKVLPFNEFGLVAITRKRTKQALERVLCQPCPYCTGSGMVKSVSTLCYEIQAEARKMAAELDNASITLRVNPEIAKALKTRESALIEELENWTRKSVIIQGDPTLHWEQYDIF
jgi:ribonuclease G